MWRSTMYSSDLIQLMKLCYRIKEVRLTRGHPAHTLRCRTRRERKENSMPDTWEEACSKVRECGVKTLEIRGRQAIAARELAEKMKEAHAAAKTFLSTVLEMDDDTYEVQA